MKKKLLSIILFFTCLSGFSQVTVTLQPNGSTGKDAELASCVACGYDVRNFGTKQDYAAFAWTNGGNSSNARSIMQFDLSSIPSGSTITSAVLSLYFNPNSAEGGHVSSFLSTNSSYLQRITSNWNESTVTWNTQPSTTTLHQVTLPKTTSSTQNFPAINVTTLVRDMVSNPSQSFGFMLRLKNEVRFNKLIFASSDHPTASLRPKLVITYIPPAAIAANDFVLPVSPLTISKSFKPSNTSVSLYPNPAQTNFAVNIVSEANGFANIQVMDITGKPIKSQSVLLSEGSNDIMFETTEWGKGIYFVNVIATHLTKTLRLIVE